jgi:methylenetetrahydrofolate reductase (NADPH)
VGVLADARFELVPVKSAEAAIAALPPGVPVSVTSSPAHGLRHTMALCSRLIDDGHHVVPHLAARVVHDRAEVRAVARWLQDHGVDEAFVIGGDSPVPNGPYDAALPFLRDLLDDDPGIRTVGLAGYPDGHPLIATDVLDDALAAKQAMLAEAGVAITVSTQMCFDSVAIRRWLEGRRAAGLTAPVRLGIPGVVSRTRLLTMGARLGVGASLRYLRKNRRIVGRLVAPGGYDPTELLSALAPCLDPLGVTGIHVFTFNELAPTLAWWRAARA